MKREQIIALFEKFESICYINNQVECWSARELQEILGYTKWDNFLKVIDKAEISCKGAGEKAFDHFADVGKMIDLAKGAQRKIDDIALTRYACYLVAQNADSNKIEVAFAQTYFAVQTRKQEIVEKRLLDVARVNAREKLSKSEKKLSSIIYERGVDEKGFGIIRSKGDQALFGGFNTNEMKRKLNIPDNRALADFLPTLTIKAKDFATELTSHNVNEKDLKGARQITDEHINNNKAVRKMLGERGVKPEVLPGLEDVKKVQRQLQKDEKKILLDIKKNKKPIK
jgi:DNA-damage-inducible protein D